jgi:NTP pyrophosphatase (non-canonical NTP hydrolase)
MGARRAFNAPASTAPPAAPAGSTSDIAALQSKILAFARERDWLQFHDPKNLSMAVAVEAGELMEHFRWARSDEALAVLKDAKTREAVSHEVADVATMSRVGNRDQMAGDARRGYGGEGIGECCGIP